MENERLKIVGIGACVMDMIYTVAHFPKEDTKCRCISSRLAGGGPAATGVVAAARLGEAAGYIGILPDDVSGNFLREDFIRYGVCMDYVETAGGHRGFTSSIWLNEEKSSRTCVYDGGTMPPLALNGGSRKAVREAEVLLIDGYEIDAAEEACRIIKEGGGRVLYDCGGLYPGVERLLALTDVMIPSEEFAVEHTGCAAVPQAAERLYEWYHPEFIAITCGSKGGITYDGTALSGYPAFQVETVDTNGAGDVFHGAFAAAMTKGLGYRECCCFASAAAAVKCGAEGGRAAIPDTAAVLRFLEERGYRIL